MSPGELRALMATAEHQSGETTEQYIARSIAEHQLSSWRVWLPGLLDEIAAFRTQAINRAWNWRMVDDDGLEEYERRMASEIDLTHEIMLGRMTLVESYRDEAPSFAPPANPIEAASARCAVLEQQLEDARAELFRLLPLRSVEFEVIR